MTDDEGRVQEFDFGTEQATGTYTHSVLKITQKVSFYTFFQKLFQTFLEISKKKLSKLIIMLFFFSSDSDW